LGQGDVLVTPELFCERERPGLHEWLSQNGGRAMALFHDAIPLRLPEITWPQSVARHPDYMRMLARFGRIAAISHSSARELTDYWRQNGITTATNVRPIQLGADGARRMRIDRMPQRTASREVVMLGIVEPRKNQELVLDAAEALHAEGVEFSVSFVGRVNPHFGRGTAQRIERLVRRGLPVRHLQKIDDSGLAALLERARFSVFPSRAEGCGLPVLESLWAGVPVLASALAPIEESAAGGGCRLVADGDRDGFVEAMRRMLIDDAYVESLMVEACARPLPTWRQTAVELLNLLA